MSVHKISRNLPAGSVLGFLLLLGTVLFAGESHHYVQLGSSFGRVTFQSSQLQKFKETYNMVNSRYQVNELAGFQNAEGLGWEAGYRHAGTWSFSITAGVLNFSKKDASNFSNGDSRTIELELKQYFLEFHQQLFRTRDFFADVFLTTFLHRKIYINSAYNGYVTNTKPKTITGKYQSQPIFATDLGIAVGLIFQPMLLSLRFYYPVYSNGKNTLIRDPNPEKAALGVDAFPADYEAFVYLNDYTPMTGEIDGWKLLLNINLLIEMFKKKNNHN